MKRGTKDALLAIAIVAVCVAGGWWALSRVARADRAQYVAKLEDARRRGYAQGLEEGMKLPPRTASTPELGALILCRDALAEAEDQARDCGASVDDAAARAAEKWYRLGREDWKALPYDCAATR